MERNSQPTRNIHDEANVVMLPTYSIYLIVFTIVFMLLAIIGLTVALYLIIKNKEMFILNSNNKQYVRQDTTVHNTIKDEKTLKNCESTLTMNSGIIEINRVSDPETPTRIEDSKIVFAKRPLKSIGPVMPRMQMDAICKEVLRKAQKTDSASFKDLNDILKEKREEKHEVKYGALNESVPENKVEENKEVKIDLSHETKLNTNIAVSSKMKDELQQQTKRNSSTKPKTEIKIESHNYTEMENQNDNKNKNNCGQNKDMKLEVSDNESICTEDSDTGTEYDTVPTPVRFRNSEPENVDLDSIPVYDILPRRSYDASATVVQLDYDTQYLLPLSREKTDSCYVNAKRHSYNP